MFHETEGKKNKSLLNKAKIPFKQPKNNFYRGKKQKSQTDRSLSDS